jgi:hypothetical protein
MTSLPDRPDLHQLRIQSKELKRDLVAGEQAALERVLASHPKFAGRPAERTERWTFTLRDAQVTIARELGFDSWKDLLHNLDTERRWTAEAANGLVSRAFKEARELKHGLTTDHHFLLALLNPARPTNASEVLTELGLTRDEVQSRIARWYRKRLKNTSGSTPMFQYTLGWTQGIAIGMGSTAITDDHLLLAMVYGDLGSEPILVQHGIDPDDALAGLRARGVATPPMGPPVPSLPVGPFGPVVYFPEADRAAVTQELVNQYPPTRANFWGENSSKWKKGLTYVFGVDTIPMEDVVRKTVKGTARDAIEVVPFAEAMKKERP